MQHAYADVNGIRMHYVTHGTGEPILFLHGFPEYWGVWKKLLAEFSKDHQVIAPDLRGYNLTSKPTGDEPYHIKHLVEDVRAFVQHLGLRKITVVSEDWGALVAWPFALHHPELIRRFVTVNMTHPALFNRDLRTDPKQQQASQYMHDFRSPGFDQIASANDFAMFKQNIFEDIRKHSTAFTDADEAEWLEALRQPGAAAAALTYYRSANLGPPDAKGSPGGSNLLDGLSEEQWKARFPVLMIYGEQDPYLMPSGLEGLDQLAPDLTVHRLPGATHWTTLQKPDEVIRHMRDFLARK